MISSEIEVGAGERELEGIGLWKEEGTSGLETLLRTDHNKGGRSEADQLRNQETVVGIAGKDLGVGIGDRRMCGRNGCHCLRYQGIESPKWY